MKIFKVKASRLQKAWIVYLERPGKSDMALTQSKRLDQVGFMARDAIALLEDVSVDSFDLDLTNF